MAPGVIELWAAASAQPENFTRGACQYAVKTQQVGTKCRSRMPVSLKSRAVRHGGSPSRVPAKCWVLDLCRAGLCQWQRLAYGRLLGLLFTPWADRPPSRLHPRVALEMLASLQELVSREVLACIAFSLTA